MAIDPNQRLYLTHYTAAKFPEKKDQATINMISMITSNTTPEQFEEAWKQNPDYRLENVGPADSRCKNGTSIHMAITTNNLKLGKYLINKLDPLYINASVSSVNDSALLNFAVWKRSMSNTDATLELIRHLVASGANVNLPYGGLEPDGFNASPLSEALGKGDVKLTKLLLQYGAEKFWAYTLDRKLIKQKFSEEENKIYKLAKKEIRDSINLFILATKEGNSSIGYLPKEVVARILTCDRVVGSNHYTVETAKLAYEMAKRLTTVLSTLVKG